MYALAFLHIDPSLWIVLAAGIGILIVVLAIRHEKRHNPPPELTVWEDEIITEDPVPDVYTARVVKKSVSTEHSGGRIGSFDVCFQVTFQISEEETATYEVSEEEFNVLNENEIGTLVIVGGKFYGFSYEEDERFDDPSIDESHSKAKTSHEMETDDKLF